MTNVLFDIETDSLDASEVYLYGALKNGEYFEVMDKQQVFNEGDTYYAHNGIGFDYPVLNHLWDTPTRCRNQLDTLVLSRLANPSRVGGHSLDNWGAILGYPKGEFTAWGTGVSPELREYCERDVRLLSRVLDACNKELQGFSPKSIELEHQVAWIIQDQMDNGWLLDEEKCYDLLAELKERKLELEDEVHERFKPRYKKDREVLPKIKKDGTMSVVGLKFLGEECLSLVGGPLTRVDYVEFNLGSRQQIGEYLIQFGWNPSKFTPKGQPIVDETTLENVPIREAQLIAEYLTVQKRMAMVQSWLEGQSREGRVHGYVNSNGAVTGRMTHSAPNVAQVTAKGKPYGAQMRACWTVPAGYKLVGMDADGLELRMLAHYMNDEDYIKTVCEGDKDAGTDVHTSNQRAAGLATRDQAKTFIYAFLYGAGDEKIGSIVGKGKLAGGALKDRFLRNTPALKNLRERVERAAEKGYLTGLDGRRIHVRSSYAALNTLLQGAGAVVMKQALVFLDKMARDAKLDYKFVGNIHDEIQTEVHEEDAEMFAHFAERAVQLAGEEFNLRCPLTGTATIGNNWMETH